MAVYLAALVALPVLILASWMVLRLNSRDRRAPRAFYWIALAVSGISFVVGVLFAIEATVSNAEPIVDDYAGVFRTAIPLFNGALGLIATGLLAMVAGIAALRRRRSRRR